MAQRRTCSLLALLTLFLAAGVAAQPILIEDVGPDGRAVPLNSPDPLYAGSGLIAAIDGSGPVGVAGPPTSWSTKNGPDWIEHIAAADEEGRLIVFYRGGKERWKAVDLTEKTGQTVAVVEPAAWQSMEGGELDEKLAIPSERGDLLAFRWRAGSDWLVENLTQQGGPPVEGAVSAWVSSGPNGTVEYVAARGTASELLVYYRRAGGVWKYVDVTARTGSGLGSRVGAGPTGWTDGGVEYIAAPSPLGYLLLFSFSPKHGWSVSNLSALTHLPDGPIWRIESRVAEWSANGRIHIAGRAPDGDLLLFARDPIEGRWGVSNLSQQAGGSQQTGRKVATAPTFWEVGSGGGRVEHLAASDSNNRLVVFSRGAGTRWKAVDVGSRTGRATMLRPTSWVTPDTAPGKENLASATPDHRLASFDRESGRDWRQEDASLTASARVVYAASHKAGVWRSDDYGRFWRQCSQAQPGEGEAPRRTLDVPVVLDVAVSPRDPRVVLAGTGSDHRVDSRAGLYRSSDGGRTWLRTHRFVQSGEVLPATQVVFAPDDPRLVFAAGGSAIVGSADGGETWQTLLSVPAAQVWHLAVSEADASGRRSLAGLGPSSLWYASAVEVRAGGSPAPFGAVTWVRDDTAAHGAGLPATNTGTTVGVGSHVMAFVPGSRDRVLVAVTDRANQTSPVYFADQAVYPNGVPAVVRSRGSLWQVDLSTFDTVAGTLQSAWSPVPLPSVYSGGRLTPSGVVYVYTRRTAEGYFVFFANMGTVHVAEGIAGAATDWHRLDGLDAGDAHRKGLENAPFVHWDPHDLLVPGGFELDLGAADAESPYDQHSSVESCAAGRLWMAHDGGVTRSSDCGASWLPAEDGLDTLNFINVAVSPRESGDDVMPYLAPYLYGGTTHNDHSFSADGGKTWKQARWPCGDCDAWFSDPAQPSHVLRLMPRSLRFDLFVESRGGPDARQDPTVRIPYPDYARPFAISFKVLEGYRPIVYTPAGDRNLPGGDYVTIAVEAQKVGGKLVPGDRVLLRARDTFTTQTGAAVWEKVSGQGGAPSGASVLPPEVDVVQASGGHDRTVFYVGDGDGVWRSERNPAGTIIAWNAVVPNNHADPALVATDAVRFFVNPYDPEELYLAGKDAVRHTTDGGDTWPVDVALDRALTDADAFRRDRRASTTGGEANRRGTADTDFKADMGRLWGESENHADELILNDMVFDRDSSRRFAVGLAGVFFSQDGKTWRTLIDSRAIPGRPRSAWFDAVSDPADQSLYVAYHGRSILKVHPIPPSSSVSWAEIQPGTMEVVPPPVAQAEVQPGTMEVVSPLAARCERYAEDAVALVQRGRELGCGFSGPRWSESHSLHRDWCVRQQVATIIGEARAREDQLVECTRRLEGSQATAKPPDRLEMMQGQLTIAGSRATECELYAITAVAQERQNRERGCRFVGPGWNPDGRAHRVWCERQSPDVLAAVTKTRGIDLEQCLAGRETAVGRNDRCTTYAATAVLHAQLNQQRGCGQAGPRWSTDFLLHYHWCERQSATVPEAEAAERRRQLTRCGVPVGQ